MSIYFNLCVKFNIFVALHKLNVMIATIIQNTFVDAVKELYEYDISENNVIIQKTRKEFIGDYTINVFPFLKHSKKNPEQTASELINH